MWTVFGTSLATLLMAAGVADKGVSPMAYRKGFILAISLLIGILGYRYFGDASWIDSIHNSSMILSGMGPVILITSMAGKIFSSIYALFSGVVFISNIGIILAPAIHRLFHILHLQEK